MNDHPIARRERTITESFCAQPGCEYEGKPAVQGHCFHRLDDTTEAYIVKVTERAERGLAEIKELAGNDYVASLESYYVSAAVNWTFTLDEVVRLRRENSALKRARGTT